MKKLLLLAVMAMMTIAVQADEEEFVVTSGDFKVVMQPGKIGRVEVDFTSDVKFKNVRITLKDNKGAKYSATNIKRKDSDEIWRNLYSQIHYKRWCR